MTSTTHLEIFAYRNCNAGNENVGLTSAYWLNVPSSIYFGNSSFFNK